MYNVYLDTETTGLVPGEIAELSMIIEEASTHQFIDAKNYFFTVNKMEPGAEEVHGFSEEKLISLSGGLRFKDKVDEIYGTLSDANIIAHNEAFDEKFLSSEFWRCGISFQPKARSCTMLYFKDILKLPGRWKSRVKNPKLSEVLDYLGISSKAVDEYSQKLFNYSGSSFHDSRFDTTGMYVAVQVFRERQNGGVGEWSNRFCI